jgi:hypothetical protein
MRQLLPLVISAAAGMAGVVGSLSPAMALVVNLNGQDYTISTVQGTWTSLRTTLIQNVWWGNSSLAQTATNAVATEFGTPNTVNTFFGPASVGPFFAWDDNVSSTTGLPTSVSTFTYVGGSAQAFAPAVDQDFTWALATLVEDNGGGDNGGGGDPTAVPFDIPGGATIPTMGGLFALGLMRQAKKKIALKNSLSKSVTHTVN